MNYQQWDCKEHGNYKYEEKYVVNCEECFTALKKELTDYKESSKNVNSERVRALYERDRLKEVLGKKIVEVILK